MPKAGPAPARRALGAGAWAYRSPAQSRRHRPRRLARPPNILQDSRGKAQGRRWKRSRRRSARGQHAPVGTGAMARALVGCMGALAKELPGTPAVHTTAPPCPRSSAGGLRAWEETQPRCGVTLDGVQRLVKETRAEIEAGTRRRQGRWEPTHAYQQDQLSYSYWLRRF